MLKKSSVTVNNATISSSNQKHDLCPWESSSNLLQSLKTSCTLQERWWHSLRTWRLVPKYSQLVAPQHRILFHCWYRQVQTLLQWYPHQMMCCDKDLKINICLNGWRLIGAVEKHGYGRMAQFLYCSKNFRTTVSSLICFRGKSWCRISAAIWTIFEH